MRTFKLLAGISNLAFWSYAFWFLHVSSYGVKSFEILLPAFGAITFSNFLFIKLLLTEKSSHNKLKVIKLLEIFLPALGAMIFSGFVVAKSLLLAEHKKNQTLGYVNFLLDNKGNIISYPTLSDSLNPSITEHTYYSSLGFMTIYLKNYLNSNFNSEDLLDTAEFVFIDKMLNGWIVPQNESFEENLTSEQFLEKLSENKIFQVTQQDVENVNKKIGFQQKISTFENEFLYSGSTLKNLSLPDGTTFSYSRTDEYRRMTFENDVITFNFVIFDGGINNFRPEHNAFHSYLARYAPYQTPSHSSFIQMKKVYINFNYDFKKYASFRNDYEDYLNLMNKIEENLNKQVFWNPLKAKLETEYILSK